ncbi:MAG: UDP-N-acetylglucosamine--N-acetylmuramyl-(pentapeptide) pyrophosphoryl-undecaprenol N-acetylglucosamine transferase [Chthonomonadaceae bacterium]|nr:UDP-N-acetylglucosamine--N-acetylmuramyl-(pentapeptide) pyrophosphoryl-undecaprenol N-acetylglucosamine transferase [Chthonomonadaceae bacterium]
MRLVVTGGGTGGHVYPALETALGALRLGWDVRYFGSNRGIERKQCAASGVEFIGFESGPVYKPFSAKGLQSLTKLLKATQSAQKALESWRPDAVFSTGGYASAPVVSSAKRLKIPYLIHEQNTFPGRTNRILGRSAFAVATVFESTAKWFPNVRIERTGMPIRQALRRSSQGALPLTHSISSAAPIVLVMGGSQGSQALNDVALATAVRMATTEVQWLHVTGLSHFESTAESLRKLAVKSDYTIKAYLDAEEMAAALFSCSLAVCRSGAGTMAELAAFRKPAVYVPYPSAFGDHQRLNAQEFVDIGASEMLLQPDLAAGTLEPRIHAWTNDPSRVSSAAKALGNWDVPDALDRILELISQTASLGAFVA